MSEREDWPAGPQVERLKWAAVDCDGTLWESRWTPENPTAAPGPPIRENVTKARRLYEAGYKIVLHTARPWADYLAIEQWAEENLPFPIRAIICGKILASKYIDDRAVNASEESWL